MPKTPTATQLDTVRGWMSRASRRLDGAEVAARRPHPSEGEFDNNFDGVVTAIFHIVDAFEMARTGIHRRVGEGEQSTVIRSAVTALRAAKIPDVPNPERLIDLNARRNTSVHGEWFEVLDTEGLEDAIKAARSLLVAVRIWMERQNIRL